MMTLRIPSKMVRWAFIAQKLTKIQQKMQKSKFWKITVFLLKNCVFPFYHFEIPKVSSLSVLIIFSTMISIKNAMK